jgi:methylmalonyl-CoA mutase cobalamin-binding subunit
MRSNEAAEVCSVPSWDAPVLVGWEGAREAAEAAAQRNARLRQVVSERIAPRLALLHHKWIAGDETAPPAPADIAEFCEAILGRDPAAADTLFERLRDRGLTVESLFETLLAPTARRLGELWEEDICDFVDVTIGVNRLRIMMERYTQAPVAVGDARRRALLIAPPREGHLFGLQMIASFLRASGWEATLEVGRSAQENAATAAGGWFAAVGVTISKAEGLGDAARAIKAVRRASLNTMISVVAGGSAVQGRPDLAARIGADATAEDGPTAALLLQKLYLVNATTARRRA